MAPEAHTAGMALSVAKAMWLCSPWKDSKLSLRTEFPYLFFKNPSHKALFVESQVKLDRLHTPVYSCLTVCPTIPQKTIPLATPMETVLTPCVERRSTMSIYRKDEEQRKCGKAGEVGRGGEAVSDK